MPIKIKKDNTGLYYQYGTTGHKYYFNPNSEISMDKAYHKCMKQVAAIYAQKYYQKKSNK
jgi:hypothetical protein